MANERKYFIDAAGQVRQVKRTFYKQARRRQVELTLELRRRAGYFLRRFHDSMIASES